MSKNERFLRTLIAGVVFATIGIVATVEFDAHPGNRIVTRSPAAAGCKTAECLELIRLKKAILENPGSDTASNRDLKIEIENREAKLFRDAGGVLAAMFRDRVVEKDELAEAALFLVETFKRDGGGATLDAFNDGLGEEKTAKALIAIEAEIDSLAIDGVIEPELYKNYKAMLALFREQGADVGPPTK